MRMNESARPRIKTNVEIVTEFMECGSPMNQAFAIEALSRYAKEVITNAEQIRASMKNSFIEPNAWIACAADWQNIRRLGYGICTKLPVDTKAKS